MNKPISEWLMTCPLIPSDSFFFQYLNANDKANNFQTLDNYVEKTDILGIVDGIYSVMFSAFKSLNETEAKYNDENFNEFTDVQGIIDWIKEQEKIKNYPVVSDKTITKITVPLSPTLSGVDRSGDKANAKYMFSIEFSYRGR